MSFDPFFKELFKYKVIFLFAFGTGVYFLYDQFFAVANILFKADIVSHVRLFEVSYLLLILVSWLLLFWSILMLPAPLDSTSRRILANGNQLSLKLYAYLYIVCFIAGSLMFIWLKLDHQNSPAWVYLIDALVLFLYLVFFIYYDKNLEPDSSISSLVWTSTIPMLLLVLFGQVLLCMCFGGHNDDQHINEERQVEQFNSFEAIFRDITLHLKTKSRRASSDVLMKGLKMNVHRYQPKSISDSDYLKRATLINSFLEDQGIPVRKLQDQLDDVLGEMAASVYEVDSFAILHFRALKQSFKLLSDSIFSDHLKQRLDSLFTHKESDNKGDSLYLAARELMHNRNAAYIYLNNFASLSENIYLTLREHFRNQISKDIQSFFNDLWYYIGFLAVLLLLWCLQMCYLFNSSIYVALLGRFVLSIGFLAALVLPTLREYDRADIELPNVLEQEYFQTASQSRDAGPSEITNISISMNGDTTMNDGGGAVNTKELLEMLNEIMRQTLPE
jgi:hypothetical protein